jgi:PAS domain S-box-containing protein
MKHLQLILVFWGCLVTSFAAEEQSHDLDSLKVNLNTYEFQKPKGNTIFALVNEPYDFKDSIINNYILEANENQQQKIKAQQLELEKKNIVILLSFAILFAFLVGVVVAYQIIQEKKRANKQLIRLNKEISERNEFIQSNLERIEQLQTEVETRERQYRNLIENANDGIYEVNENGQFTFINPLIESITGYSSDEILKMNFAELIRSDYAKEVTQAYIGFIKKLAPSCYLEFPIQTKQGKTVWIGQNVKFFYDGKWMWKASVVARDITERKSAEIELKKAKEQAEAASMAKSEFLANVSHELRTPLNGVIGFTDLLANTKLNDTQKKYLNFASLSAKSLLNLIDDILDLVKLDSGKIQLKIEKVNLKSTCYQVIEMVRYQAQNKGLKLEVSVDPSIPSCVFTDEIRLKQILTNLLNNAVKFTNEGYIQLSVYPVNTEIENNLIRFSVKDTGIGIDPQIQKKIFDAFVQEDISTTKKFGGVGLGLTISNKLLELMTSNLRLTSKVDEGSEFYFDVDFKEAQGPC